MMNILTEKLGALRQRRAKYVTYFKECFVMKTLNYMTGSRKLDKRLNGQIGGVSVAAHTEEITDYLRYSLRLLLLLLLSTVCINVVSANGNVLDVNCTSDIANDRQNIQDAIDQANMHDTVAIHGSCLLDGERVVINKSFLTITGDASDTNNDGMVDQWDTVLKGTGVQDNFVTGPYTNMGIHVGDIPATNANINHVTIEKLKLENFSFAMVISPGVLTPNSLSCDTIQITDGNAKNIHIRDNWFTDNVNHFYGYGPSINTRYDRNLTTGGGGDSLFPPVFIVGHRTLCFCSASSSSPFCDTKVFGSFGFADIGQSKNFLLSNSKFVGLTQVGGNQQSVEFIWGLNPTVEGNRFEDNRRPLTFSGTLHGTIKDNTFKGTNPGIFTTSARDITLINTKNTLVTRNILKGGTNKSWGIRDTKENPGSGLQVALELTPSEGTIIKCNHIEGANNPSRSDDAGIIVVDRDGPAINTVISGNRFVNNLEYDILVEIPGNSIKHTSSDTVNIVGGNKVKVREQICAPDPNDD